ncbi:hypothetical protein M409DRAFT_21494 [Zasmidium cellare ATCC 36951]|uniref:Uncharacterized protein n=1 Tax=Zasmidium cellare ATCC 36951 TaxID=1080233 RepID=A0A6A6CP70_ZASCE|nr:uncharacterized protein M409DRAFT_21494 [Zasmidium cellare ATCC 36951]KAF2168048.1 hypothetical protein M409DRAFT_21494 [Zasmidium cellare ATCC 36951]
MSTAVAAPATTLPPSVERQISPRHFTSIAPSSTPTAASAPTSSAPEPAQKRARSNGSPDARPPLERSNSNGNSSPSSQRAPMIKVKKEPGSPALTSSRPRPKALDLSSSMSKGHGPHTGRPSAPLTSRESAGLVIQDVGLACLSPGFQTNDPAMREQLQRSLDVRDQQRQIIEARNKGKPGSSHDMGDGPRTQDTTLFGVQTGARTPSTSRRKGPPPGLSIAAPSAAQFANDRVIQSAPINQTFTGLRPGEYPHSRHAQHGPSTLSQTSHIHAMPATQTNNRLPPIADVFANDRLDAPRYPANNSPGHNAHPPAPSPGYPPQSGHIMPMSGRAREFRSVEEAVQGLSGGRDDLMPKVVHYGGVQPPTPPSPMPGQQTNAGAQDHRPQYATDTRPDILARTSSMNGRRRGRDEYERDNGSPPSSFNRPEPKRATFAVRGDDRDREEDWRAGMSSAEKREEFLRLCERAWDLFHS